MDIIYAEPWKKISRRMLPAVTSLNHVPAVVLIVEDEAFVRLLAVGMLADAGFRVIEAVDSDEATEFPDADSNVQLLFTNINLPGTLDGLALARKVHQRWPRIGIVVFDRLPNPFRRGVPLPGRPLFDPSAVVRHARDLTAACRPPPSSLPVPSSQK